MYCKYFSSFVCSCVGICYVLVTIMVTLGWVTGRRVYVGVKVCQVLFGTVLFMGIVGDNCNAISEFFIAKNVSII